MLLALLLLACSGAVDPVDSVVDTSDTASEVIPQCCDYGCVEMGGSGILIQVPPDDAGPNWCQEVAEASCVEGVTYADPLDEC